MDNRKKYFHFPIILSPKQQHLIHPVKEFSFRTLNRYYRLKTRDILLVGANTGSEISNFYKIENAKVFLVEPLPTAFVELSHRVVKEGQSHRTVLHNVALGATSGEVNIHPASNNGESSSTLKPKIHMTLNPDITFGEPFSVKQLTLREILNTDCIPNFWIIDTQGSELDVLIGGSEFLNHVDYLLIEINRDENYENCAKVEDIDELLRQYGFNRQLTRWWGTWGDGFYSRGYSFPTLRRVLRR